ncbi:hypothetical protein ASPBRDRAFT_210162 [Aspergillus brasiliensis CBS 101740]|uniref:Uncharacterized protein n=1 Tax=Aspergillus brasiliensis (strain CBS 101740 / IMI 381727 / IBT 21946) TaxID=767769 RepID=A0A1L9U9H4_ASPBC|nr:hypothetical protein ASPBRDRAFT_210162 [Aspergillus brasiliensis CBS 101740]
MSKKLKLEEFGLAEWKQKADQLLATLQCWDRYHQSFTSNSILEGTFALAKKYQGEASGTLDESFRSDVSFTPVAHRTRGRVGGLEQKMREVQLQTPSKSTGMIPDTPGGSPFDSPGPSEIQNQMYPQTEDEQIVNSALVDFLNALSIHFPEACDWTLHRKSFKAEFEHASYEARTDGYLKGGTSGKARALIEVKPMLRDKKRIPICMQEAAQMVAWIKSDPDFTGVLNLPGRRLHVSQDRHLIYLIFAEYDDKYIQYLTNSLPAGSPRPFLKMHEFGPWNTLVRSDMEDLGGILLAIALRAYADDKLSN